jgi:hypothetical protein
MTRQYDKAEFARRGDAVFEQTVRPHLNPSDDGKFASIDIETGAYAVATDALSASDELRARRPEAQIWLIRIGSRYLQRFGGRSLRNAQ